MSPKGNSRLLQPSGGGLFSDDETPLSAEQQQFEQLLQQFDYAFKRGSIIKGTVLGFESGGAVVDIGAKTAAFAPGKEIAPPNVPLEDVLKLEETYEFYILRDENEDGQFTLSRKRVSMAHTWKDLEEALNADTVVQGVVSAVVKGGLLVEVMGLRGFVPSSHLRVRVPFEKLVGETLPFKILSLEQQSNNIILSHRKVVAEQMAEQRRDLFSNLEIGSVVEGEVVRLTDFGAFVDLGGIDGLLPLSQMSWRWVEHPTDILKIGDKVKVEVIGIDGERQRVSLSIKSQFNDPWLEVSEKLQLGDEVDGTITRVKHFGAFVEVYPGVEALLPSRDIMEHEQSKGVKLDAGSEIKTFIVKFNPEERRISLSFYPNMDGASAPPFARGPVAAEQV